MYGTEMAKMLRCDGEKYYDELFSFACPKFIAASPSVFYNQVLSKAIALLFFFCKTLL
jgi:hypothetical protein